MLLIAVPAFLFYSFLLFQFLCTPASFEVHCSFLRCPHLFPAVRKEGTVVFFSREKNRLFSDSHLSESDFSLLSLSLSLSLIFDLMFSQRKCVSLCFSFSFPLFCLFLSASDCLPLISPGLVAAIISGAACAGQFFSGSFLPPRHSHLLSHGREEERKLE